jgi:hypothetical protein
MNAEIKTEMTTQELPKSKRLSSMIWILVLWGFVRLISEMGGTGWEKAFDGMAHVLGLWPSTALLLMGIAAPSRKYQSIFRLGSLLAVTLGLVFGVIVVTTTHSQKIANEFISHVHLTLVLATVLFALFIWSKESRTKP